VLRAVLGQGRRPDVTTLEELVAGLGEQRIGSHQQEERGQQLEQADGGDEDVDPVERH
jgi:hypothetical protein